MASQAGSAVVLFKTRITTAYNSWTYPSNSDHQGMDGYQDIIKWTWWYQFFHKIPPNWYHQIRARRFFHIFEATFVLQHKWEGLLTIWSSSLLILVPFFQEGPTLEQCCIIALWGWGWCSPHWILNYLWQWVMFTSLDPALFIRVYSCSPILHYEGPMFSASSSEVNIIWRHKAFQEGCLEDILCQSIFKYLSFKRGRIFMLII